jgi:ABC-2 type transport system ATP-binding protein
MNTVKDMCDRAIWLTHGVVTGEGDPSELVENYTETMLGNYDRGVDGSVRRGSGEIQITAVEMRVGAEGVPVKRFRTGDDVRIRLHYRAEKSVPRPVVAITIDSLGGATVTAPCTRDVGMVPDALSGEGTIDIDLKDVSLLPGTYDLHTTITDFNRSHIYDNLHLAMRFDVMTGRPYETGGLITVRPQWTIG